MQVTISIKRYCDQFPEDHQSRTFTKLPVILGRSPSCDYLLNDPSKYISSNHALLLEANGLLQLEDTSANGVYLNGSEQPVGRGNRVTIQSLDSVNIGEYLLQFAIDTHAAQTSSDDDWFADIGSGEKPEAAYDPWKGAEPEFAARKSEAHHSRNTIDILPDADGAFQADDWFESKPENNPKRAASGEDQIQNTSTLPSSIPSVRSSIETVISGEEDEDPFDFLFGDPSEGQVIGSTVDLESTAPPSPLPDVEPKPAPATDGGARSEFSVGTGEPHPDPLSAQQQNKQEPRRPAPPVRTDASEHAANTELVAMLKAAGVNPVELAQLDDATVAPILGNLLHDSIKGIMLLLQSRAEMKNAIRSDVTTLSNIGNNPLKFSFSASEALTKLLLANDRKGYMGPEEALTQAVEDLKTHQLALLEGMRAAVNAMLVQFDPQQLEKKIEKSNPIIANIKLTREAKLWQHFEEKYEDIRQQALEDFNELFGREFLKAYEKRLAELGRRPEF